MFPDGLFHHWVKAFSRDDHNVQVAFGAVLVACYATVNPDRDDPFPIRCRTDSVLNIFGATALGVKEFSERFIERMRLVNSVEQGSRSAEFLNDVQFCKRL